MWDTAIAVGGSLLGGLLGSSGAKKAAKAQAAAAEAAVQEQRRQFDLMREDTSPYREIGRQALGTLGNVFGYKLPVAGYDPNPSSSGPVTIDNDTGQPINAAPDYSNFFASPDFQFKRQQGDQAITRNASALGRLASGNTGAALTEYSGNLAAGEFGNWFNRQAALAGIGQSAVNTATSAGNAAAGNIGNALMAGGNARASGIADSYNAWGNALGTIGGMAYNHFNRPQQQGRYSGWTPPYAGYGGALA